MKLTTGFAMILGMEDYSIHLTPEEQLDYELAQTKAQIKDLDLDITSHRIAISGREERIKKRAARDLPYTKPEAKRDPRLWDNPGFRRERLRAQHAAATARYTLQLAREYVGTLLGKRAELEARAAALRVEIESQAAALRATQYL